MKIMQSNPVHYRLDIKNGAIHFTPLSRDRDAFSVPADTIFNLSVSHHQEEFGSYGEAFLDGMHSALNNGAPRDRRERDSRFWFEIQLHAGEHRELRLTIYQA